MVMLKMIETTQKQNYIFSIFFFHYPPQIHATGSHWKHKLPPSETLFADTAVWKHIDTFVLLHFRTVNCLRRCFLSCLFGEKKTPL